MKFRYNILKALDNYFIIYDKDFISMNIIQFFKILCFKSIMSLIYIIIPAYLCVNCFIFSVLTWIFSLVSNLFSG